MRIKKILSLAVVLAMVLTVVPMFGLTASAAGDRGDYPIGLLKGIATEDFDGKGTDKGTDGTVADTFSGWDRYTSYTGNVHTVNGVLEFRNNGSSSAHTAAAVNKSGLGKNKDYGIVSFEYSPVFNTGNNSGQYYQNHKMSFALRDAGASVADGKVFTNFTIDKGKSDEIGQTLVSGDKVDILWYNKESGGYTVEYYVNGLLTNKIDYTTEMNLNDLKILEGDRTTDGTPEQKSAPEEVNGFSALCCFFPADSSGNQAYRFPNLKVFSGNWPTSVTVENITSPETIDVASGETGGLPKTVSVQYKVNGTQDVTCDAPVTWTPASEGAEDLVTALTNKSGQEKEVALKGSVGGSSEKEAELTVKSHYVYNVASDKISTTTENDAKAKAENIPATTGKFIADFDITYAFGSTIDYWIMLANGARVNRGDFFRNNSNVTEGGGAIGIGVTSSKKMTLFNGSGDGQGNQSTQPTSTEEITDGKYHITVTVDTAAHTYSVTVSDKDGKEIQLSENGTANFRTWETTSIDTFAVLNSGSANSSSTVENLKIVYGDLVEPAKPTAELGWDGKDFTVNFRKGDNTDAIEITPEDESGTFTGQANSVDVTGKEGAAVTTGVTNRIYSAVAVAAGGLKKSEAVKSSVYELVVKEILGNNYATDKSKLSPERIAKASEVITKGGIAETLDAETTAQIIDTTQKESNIYTIKDAATTLGIGFVYVDGGIYIGSGDTASTFETQDKVIYSKLTVSQDKVELSVPVGAAAAAETITLSLDSVNIEFIETLIEDTEAEGADAAQDFIPEL